MGGPRGGGGFGMPDFKTLTQPESTSLVLGPILVQLLL